MFFAIGSSMKVIVRAIIVLSPETFQLDSYAHYIQFVKG